MKRTLAIGDIHGCSKAFETLLKEVKPSSDDVLVTLGDYVDRGPDSKAVLDRLIRLEGETTLVPLLGNHEVLFLDAWKSGTLDSPWMRVGGRETLHSYALGNELSWVYLPEAHHEFLTERCVRYHETDTHFFVHGGAEPTVPLADQTDDWLFWTRYETSEPHVSGKTMVCGHSAQRNGLPLRTAKSICLDSWVYGEGWLSCLIIEFNLVIQANQRGQVRRIGVDHVPERS